MSRMKAMAALAFFAAAMDSNTNLQKRKRDVEENPKGDKPQKKIIPKGLKPFDIDGETIWAINEKNAIRKSNRNK